ncbi:MAG: tuaH, partial [Candidatus Solibacter sp.]|nr:tuaH [Candidatus Solibacter sp.]
MFPLVSVVVVGYNRLELLRKTITSFLNTTTYPRNSLELILCDDGSPESVQDQMRLLPFDVFLMASENRGMGNNTNKGIRAAAGAYILQLQDDWECGGP